MKVERVLVVGAGAMGSQIAMLAALGGMRVHVHDAYPGALAAAEQALRGRVGRRVEKGQLSQSEMDDAFARLTFTPDLATGAADAQLIIEAIKEDLDAKSALFAELDALAPAEAILATNSSSITASLLGARTRRPGRVVNAHFFNPPLVMDCVEVVAHERLDPDVAPAVLDVCRRMGKAPVALPREVPGIVANRILSAIVREAAALTDGGFATVEAVDEICRNALGHPMGPFELLDMAGLDVNLQMQQLIFEQTGVDQDRPIPAVVDLVGHGRLGRKSGGGFYDYDEETSR
ncbi:3-hydroxyacyl-CoA dehydrogenase family protein [Microbacterium insulae]|uniref:3-hydroxyacyl-CoA dehydrogenase family protein n=1 Tax=Microbacterium insulae TaxID=483014 RepID=A0ABW3AI71_9MICO